MKKALDPVLDILVDQTSQNLVQQSVMVIQPGGYRTGTFNDLGLDYHFEDKTGMKVFKGIQLKKKSRGIVITSRKRIFLYDLKRKKGLDYLGLKDDIKDFGYDKKNQVLYVLSLKLKNEGKVNENPKTERSYSRKKSRRRPDRLSPMTERGAKTQRGRNKSSEYLNLGKNFGRSSRSRSPSYIESLSKRGSLATLKGFEEKWGIQIFRLKEKESKFSNLLGKFNLNPDYNYSSLDIDPSGQFLIIAGYKFYNKQNSNLIAKSSSKRYTLKASPIGDVENEHYASNVIFVYKIGKMGELELEAEKEFFYSKSEYTGQFTYVKYGGEYRQNPFFILATNQIFSIQAIVLEQTGKIVELFEKEVLSPGKNFD